MATDLLSGGGGSNAGAAFRANAEGNSAANSLARYQRVVWANYQKFLDSIYPLLYVRWAATAIFVILYLLRVYFLAGFYIVTYALGIYILNLLIGFLSPRFDPEAEDDSPNALPTTSDEPQKEFRPFERRLPEFKFWLSLTRATLIALFATFFDFLDIPVFWPILLLYFGVLFFMTMRKQIQHMIKHKYLPFSVGKPKYQPGQNQAGVTGMLGKNNK